MNRLMSIRIAAILLTVVLVLTLLVEAKVKITYFNWFASPHPSNTVELEIIDLFHEAHPDIEVEKQGQLGSASVWEKTMVMAAGGISPDVVCIAIKVGLPARRSGLLTDLRPYLERDAYDMSQFRPGYQLTLGPDWAWGGAVYGLPWGLGILNIFYNKDQFGSVGLRLPYKGWTTTEFVEYCKRLTRDVDGDGSIDIYGSKAPNLSYNFWPFIFGGDFADPETGELTVDDPKFVKTLEWIYNLRTNYNVTGGGQAEFLAGKLAMTYEWDSQIAYLLKHKAGFDWSTTWAPRGEGAEVISYGHGHIMALMKPSKHPDTAWEFMKFYYSSEPQRLLAKAFMYPMTKEGMAAVGELVEFPSPLNSDEILRPYFDVGKLKTIAFWVPGLDGTVIEYNKKLGSVLQGDMSIREWIEGFKNAVAARAAEFAR